MYLNAVRGAIFAASAPVGRITQHHHVDRQSEVSELRAGLSVGPHLCRFQIEGGAQFGNGVAETMSVSVGRQDAQLQQEKALRPAQAIIRRRIVEVIA